MTGRLGGTNGATRIAHHFGPRLGQPGAGGMASVVATYADLPLSRYQVRLTATSSVHSRIKSAEYVLPAVGALLATAARRPRPVIHVHLADRGSLLREGGILRLSRRLGLPSVATLHSSQLEREVGEGADLSRLRAVLRCAHVVHALGGRSARLLSDILGPHSELEVFPNCVTVPPPSGAAGESPPRALFAGELSRRKGLDVLLAAWPLVRAELPESELVLLGKSRDVDVPRQPGVRWLGAVSRERVLRELADCRVAVLPSRSEAQPMFILEAMAAGRPVVATPVAEVPETLPDSNPLVPIGDVESLAAMLRRFLGEPIAATAVGAANLRCAQRRYSMTAVAGRVEAAYDKAVSCIHEPEGLRRGRRHRVQEWP